MKKHDEPNRQIAAFMELEYLQSNYDLKWVWRTQPNEAGLCRIHSELLYHESWDYLMPVLKRCNEIYMGLNPFFILPDDETAYKNLKYIGEQMQLALLTFDIKVVYPMVVQFISLYEPHKKKEWAWLA